MKKIILTTLLFFVTVSLFSQEVCLFESFYLRINNEENLPTIENNDNGTIKLTHKEKYITDIFAKYIIYGFVKSFPNSESERLKNVYSIHTNSRNLLKDLTENVSDEIFWIDPSQINLNIIDFDEDVVQYFNKKTFYRFAEFESISEGCSGNDDCTKITNLKQVINMYYDENKELLVLESKENTTCINFEIKFKQVFNDSGHVRLIVWEIDSENTCLGEDLYESCKVEMAFIETLKVYPILELEKEKFTIHGSTPIFTENIFRFVQESLSVSKEKIKKYVSISHNTKKELLSIKEVSNVIKIYEVKIFDITGREVIGKKKSFNTINLSVLKSGIYFLKIKMNNGLLFDKKIVKS